MASLIDSGARFDALLEALAESRPRAFGVDTEAANFERGGLYRESPSLLQIAFRHVTGDVRVAVIDVLAIRDVRRLQPFLIEPTAVIFAHNYAYDERMLTRMGLRPRCVYDTCRAAHILYDGANRLADLSERLLGAPMDKELQVSDWGRRPLSRAQITYAARDAADTLMIGEIVRQMLPDVPPSPPTLPPYARASYTALISWRATTAAAQRSFPEDVLPQRTLREVALRRPTTQQALAGIAGMGDTRMTRYSLGIFATLATVEMDNLVAGTVLSGARFHAPDIALTDRGLRIRLDFSQTRPEVLRRIDLPHLLTRAQHHPQMWVDVRPALASMRLSSPMLTQASGRAALTSTRSPTATYLPATLPFGES